MRKKKSKFLTFLFSLMPGAGHMYMGFMQRGAVYMALFLGIMMVATYLSLSVLTFAAAVVWFYAFFECWNIAGLSDMDFANLEDKPELFGIMLQNNSVFQNQKVKTVGGVALILCGGYALVRTLFSSMGDWLYRVLGETAYEVFSDIPRMLVALLIIYIGFRLIKQNKEAVINTGDDNAN